MPGCVPPCGNWSRSTANAPKRGTEAISGTTACHFEPESAKHSECEKSRWYKTVMSIALNVYRRILAETVSTILLAV